MLSWLNWILSKKPSESNSMVSYNTNFNSSTGRKPVAPPKPAPVKKAPPVMPKVQTGMGFSLSAKDEAHLKKVHPDLARIIRRAAADWSHDGQVFFITCSLRTLDEQKALVARGASKTLRSRHLPGRMTGLSHAIDLAVKVDGKLSWDWPLYSQLAKAVKAAAKAENLSIEWGGDWRTFKDGPHYQLPWAKYPG